MVWPIIDYSDNLLRTNCGTLIDSHAVMFRLNNARISGYTVHVDSKTNFSVIKCNILHLCMHRLGRSAPVNPRST
jgi:beta-1,6-galactosyltransferase